jgi:flavin reductase (DIM6/NTAB) family NADH-FMN oxidoreductase RutF
MIKKDGVLYNNRCDGFISSAFKPLNSKIMVYVEETEEWIINFLQEKQLQIMSSQSIPLPENICRFKSSCFKESQGRYTLVNTLGVYG